MANAAEENSDDRMPVKPSTKQLIAQEKGDGMTYDRWLREDPRLPTEGEE